MSAVARNTNRLPRLLAMVPYFLARPGIKLEVAAADLGLTTAQLTKDLELLYVCGLPGYQTDDLIDIQFWDGYVNVIYPAGIDRPLRLTGTEANVLLVALRMLLDSQGALDPGAIRRAVAKIEEAMGASHRAVPAPAADTAELPVTGTIRTALAQGKALRIRYYTPSRDAVTERIVDPIRVQVVDSQGYLDAWCRNSAAQRLFRFDRVEEAAILDEPAAAPELAAVGTGTPMPAVNHELPVALLEIDPDHIWLIEYLHAELEDELTETPTGPVRARLSYGSPEWLARTLNGFGGRVRILGDDEQARAVRELMAQSAVAARSRY